MNPSIAVLTFDQWQILFHQTMAALLRAREAVKRKIGFWGTLSDLWRASRDLKELNANSKAISELPDGMLTEDFIQTHIPEVQKLLRSIEELIDSGKRHGLMNRSLTSAALGSIKIHGEHLADYLDTLEMSLDPEVLKALEEGQRQIDNGEFEISERLY